MLFSGIVVEVQIKDGMTGFQIKQIIMRVCGMFRIPVSNINVEVCVQGHLADEIPVNEMVLRLTVSGRQTASYDVASIAQKVQAMSVTSKVYVAQFDNGSTCGNFIIV